MPQHRDIQFGIFHVTTRTADSRPWCTQLDIPEILIENLRLSRAAQAAKLYAFNVLPNHMHIILSPGTKGLSRFMQSFKSNGVKDVRDHLRKTMIVPQRRGVAAAGIKGIAWQKSFFDERIRDSRQCGMAMAYVQGNAMHHSLVTGILDWPWTSLHFPHLLDEMEMWLD